MSQWAHASARQEQGMMVDRPQLINGELTSSEVTDIVFPILSRIYSYAPLARCIARATSSTTMAAQRRYLAVHQMTLATMG